MSNLYRFRVLGAVPAGGQPLSTLCVGVGNRLSLVVESINDEINSKLKGRDGLFVAITKETIDKDGNGVSDNGKAG